MKRAFDNQVKFIVQCLTVVGALAAGPAFAEPSQSAQSVATRDEFRPSTISVTPGAQGAMMPQPAKSKAKKLAIVLFPGFETLDVFGPVQMWGRLDDYELVTVSEQGGQVRSTQGLETFAQYSFANAPRFDIVMVPGGMGTRTEIHNGAMLEFLRKQDKGSEWTVSVCTGSALLARAGLLDGRKATTNKMAWKFVTSGSPDVSWQGRARWVVDGKYVTSSGVSAGTDMALGLVEILYGRERADKIARRAEYSWNSDPTNDAFAKREVGTKP